MRIKGTQTIILLASILGTIDSGYLSYAKVVKAPLVCTPGLGDCNAVNSSPYSVLLGVPVAYIGLAGYLAILLVVLFGEKIKFIKPYTLYGLFGMSLVGFLCSVYFTYLEFWVIKAVCQWCLVSALVMTVIFVTTLVQMVSRQES